MAPSPLPWAPLQGRAPLHGPPSGSLQGPGERNSSAAPRGRWEQGQLGEEPGASAASAWASAWLGFRLSEFGLNFSWISASALISAGFCFDFDLI